MRGKPVVSIFAAALMYTGVVNAQGFYVESIHPDRDKEVTKFFYMPKMLKMVDDDGQTTIIRLDKETIYTVDPEKKTYSSMTFDEMKTMMGRAKFKLDDAMQKRLEKLTPEQRKMVEEKMGAFKNESASSEVTYQVTPTGETKSISGFSCAKYIVKKNGKDFQTVWATNQVGGFDNLKKDMTDLTDRLSSAMGAKRNLSLWFKDVQGFPVQTESYGSVSVARKIERKSIPSSEFEVPTGYTKEKNKMEESLNSMKE